ncbi:MAG: hypothetical protein ABI318_03520 [Chthoniobacteraceae bacterium]
MRAGRPSIFAAASWLVPIFVFLMMQPYVEEATARERGDWFPGMGAQLARLGIASGLAFSLGLLSIIRRERFSWIGAIPCIFGGLFLFWFALLILREGSRSAFPAIQRSIDLTVGILMALNGVFFLVWLLPKASAHLAREQQADGIGEKDARMKAKAVKLFGIATLIAGIAFILIHALELF